MRKIMDKLNTKASTEIMSESFIAEVTNPELKYQVVLETTVDADTTEEEINDVVDQAFKSHWGV